MPEFHTIRLHGPWQADLLESYGPPVESVDSHRRLKIPSTWETWLGDSFRGVVELTRKFGFPTGLTDEQTIWLVVEEIDYQGDVFLNEHSLGSIQLGDPPLRIEVRRILNPSNQLRILARLPVQSDRPGRERRAGGLTGGVRLEISDSD